MSITRDQASAATTNIFDVGGLAALKRQAKAVDVAATQYMDRSWLARLVARAGEVGAAGGRQVLDIGRQGPLGHLAAASIVALCCAAGAVAEEDSVVTILEERVDCYVVSDADVVVELHPELVQVGDLIVDVALVHLEAGDAVAEDAAGRRPGPLRPAGISGTPCRQNVGVWPSAGLPPATWRYGHHDRKHA